MRKEEQAGKAPNEPIDKFNDGIGFAELTSLGWFGDVCLPGEDYGEPEEDGEGGEGLGSE